MKNKSNIDSSPEHNQEPTEKGEIKLLDVVALTQDVPEHNLKRGEVGTVVEILSNGEAYEVEFSDDNGQMYKCLSFPASQLKVLHQEPIKVDAKRQAHASLRGYLYQIWHSVNAWVHLADDDILYLEGAEDFDIISDDAATTTQVKDTQRNITLRSKDVIDAINHYWKLQNSHPKLTVKFRFLTRSKIGVEQGNPFGKSKAGLQVWSRCSGDEAAITKISEFLQTEGEISDEVNDFLKIASPQEIYEQLIEPITWETESKPASFVEQSINEKLVLHGNQLGFLPSEAKKVADALLKETLKIATQKANRALTKVRFLEIFEEQTTQSTPTPYLRHLQTQTTIMGNVGSPFMGVASNLTIQSQSSIQTAIPQFYSTVIPRADKVLTIRTELQSEGIAIIQGGTGRGKTTLAKLTANDIGGSWLWVNFTNREPLQVAQLLQQLAIIVSNESDPVNLVLDDLNLEPRQLRTYEEVLGIVVYRVLERGAKLLITSQYPPPNNLIRSLGLSSSVVTPVPNFTISEIKEFAQQLGCPTGNAETWTKFIYVHTSGHPRLVHARITQLREKGWKQQNVIENILQTPPEIVEEREAARQLLLDLPEDRREFLYRLSLLITEFRKDYAINIGEIPEPILHPGDVFSQLVGPWIDQVSKNYYTISPLLKNAAKDVWSKSKVSALHAEVANAILKANNLTTIEARAVLTHSMIGQNKEGFISVIHGLMTAPEDSWEMLCQEFSWFIYLKTEPPEELFPGDPIVNQVFRPLQYRIAVEVKPENALKILEIWDQEIKPYEPHESYLLSRLMLATQALMYYQVLLPAKRMVAYLKEIIDITNNLEEVQEIYDNSVEQLKKYKTEKSNYFSILFGFIYARRPMDAPFLNELIDALDELNPDIRALLLADFEDDTIDSRVLIDGIWRSEADLENPDWTRCLQVFDKAIERTIAWDYPHFAAAAARGKATIYDEYLNEPNTAHEVIQDFVSKVGPSPIIEEQQAVIYLHQKRYKEALSIYERILPKWDPPAGQLDVMPSVACRRAAMCAAHLDDWKKATTFLEDGTKRTHKTMNAERYVGFYADAGFAHFKAGNMLESIKLLHLALQNFEMIPQDNTNLTYFTLKKRLMGSIGWIAYHEDENYTAESEEPSVGFCSNPETNEEVLNLPDYPIGYAWSTLAKLEYKFGHEAKVVDRALHIAHQDADIVSISYLSLLKIRHDFKNKTFNELPERIQELSNVCDSIKKHIQSGKGIEEDEIASIRIATIPNFTFVENITVMLVASLLVQLPTGADTREILAIWRTNSSELPIKENMIVALDLIESMLDGSENNALSAMKAQDTKYENRLAAALKIVHNIKTSPENLFHAHTLITTCLINNLKWLDPVVSDLAELLSAQWLEKIKFQATLKTPIITVPQIEHACKSNETGTKKIGQILLAVLQAVSIKIAPETLQQFRSWTDSSR